MPETQQPFKDRVAVVTGAGQGIGRGYALALAERGARVVVNDIGESSGREPGEPCSKIADAVVDEIKRNGGEAVANYDSVSSPEGGENIVRTAISNYGRLDILINNAGILRDKSFLKLEPDVWDAVHNVNLKGVYTVSQSAFKVMKENHYGRIVLTSSTAAFFGNFGQANYASAKLGVIGLMNVLKIEGAKYDIKVNTVCPAAATQLTKALFDEKIMEKQGVGHVVPMALFLCTDQCPVTGHVYYAGTGVYKRLALVAGDGIGGEQDREFDIEDIAANFERIDSLKSARDYPASGDFRKEVYRKAGLPDK